MNEEKRERLSLLAGGILFAVGFAAERAGGAMPVYGALYAVSYGLLAWEILWAAVKNLLRREWMDETFLMSIASLGAFAIGAYAEGVAVILFYRIGEFFQDRAAEQSREQILKAADLRPDTVTLETGETVAASSVSPGDRILIRPGDRVPLDGIVLAGESRLDTSPVTGEPVPQAVGKDDPVISGCINQSGVLTVRVTAVLEDSTASRILRAVEDAAESKPKAERFITRFARIYTPAVVGAAAVTAVIPSLITGQWGYWIYTALSFLVMSCPCALVLSVPLAYFAGIGGGSRRGILFKSGVAMERLSGIRTVALDKTGTVTEGRFAVREAVGDVLALACACEAHSTHPVAESIRLAGLGLTVPEAESIRELPGLGILAEIGGKTVLCGNEKLLTLHGVEAPPVSKAGTVVYVAQAGTCLGYLRVGDELKPDSRQAADRLRAMGLSLCLLTGDREENARQTGEALGIRQIYAGLLPEEKASCIRRIRKEQGGVLFVGDGINDAPVLAGADAGAAMGSGTDAAIAAADLVLMNSRMSSVPEALMLAKTVRRIVRQNVILSLGIKAAVMVLGLLGYASLWLAVLADTGVALVCVLNAVRPLKAG